VSAVTAGRTRSGLGVRGRELSLLLGAVLVSTGAAALLELSRSATVPVTALTPVLALAAGGFVTHLALRTLAPDADPTLLPLTVLLNGLGLVIVRRVDLVTEGSLAATQTVWSLVSIGALCGLLLWLKESRTLGRYQYSFGLLTIVLLLLPLVPGITAGEINGAVLWIRVAGMTFQPGEIAKLTMVLFLAGYLERKRALLSVVRPPDVLGEVSLLDGSPRSASAEAIEDCAALALSRAAFLELVHSHPVILDAVMRALGGLIRRLTEQNADHVFLDLPGRVAKALVRLAGDSQAAMVTIELNQSQLAEMAGGSRQSVNQAIGSFSARGWLRTEGRRIIVTDLPALRRRAGMTG
jgi:CRP-like cAMP-binding protein